MVEKYYSEQSVDIYCGHVLDVLKSLDNESVQMALTSPPYWGLRNYAGGTDIVWGGDESCEHIWEDNPVPGEKSRPHGPSSTIGAKSAQHGVRRREATNTCSLCGAWRGQLGLEPTPELYVEHLMMVFREVKRVLRKDGSFYLNIGDTYASGKGTCFNPGGGENSLKCHAKLKEARAYPLNRGNKSTLTALGLQPKCMVCIPERVMFAMIEDNWILRNKLVWHKPNSMPSSVKDRFSTTYEMLYFFVKQRKYYFDLDTVRVPHKTQSLERYQRGINDYAKGHISQNKAVGSGQKVAVPPGKYGTVGMPKWFAEMHPPDEDYKGKFDDIFGHEPNPQSFNLRVRDVKRGKGGATAQGGKLKASDKEVEEYEYPEKHHGSLMNNQERLHID